MNTRHTKIMKILAEVSRVIVGLTFVFSGLVKTIDPLGSTYKIQDYLIAFKLSSLHSFGLVFAIILCVLELSIGFFILLGIYRKWTSRILLIFMAVMTPVTLYLAIRNPVKDCGCFGDAVIISNWQTFYKNIVLSTCAILIALYHKQLYPFYSKKAANYASLFVIIFSTLLAIYNVIYLPIIDFRPYKIGTNIAQIIEEDETNDAEFENIFVYEKDGKQKEFTEANYPWQDSTWTFVEMKTKMIHEGKTSKIEDFDITLLQKNDTTEQWEAADDITHDILSNPDYSLWLVAYQLPKLSAKRLEKIKNIRAYAQSKDVDFYCFTSSPSPQIEEWEAKYNTGLTFCHADERTLKTIIRSNPGLVLMEHGTIINKWDRNSIPDTDALLHHPAKTSSASELLIIFILIVIPLIVMKIWNNKLNKDSKRYSIYH